jgi:lysophospholipase L1-like esterase
MKTRFALGVVLCLGACSACSGTGAERQEPVGVVRQSIMPPGGTWVGTWAASPESCGTTFNQQTLRQIVYTSIGGSAARVQFSNAFGADPVTIADVHIAQSTSGSSVDTTTDRPVTFGGQTTTTVPAGGLAVSDSIDFAVTALSDVVVSAYLPESVNDATCHQQGTQTNYVASGDVSGSETLNGAQTMASYYLLANLDVQNPAALGAVVAFGASITDGFASAQDANHRWPNFLATRLNTANLTVGVLNQGINGNQMLVDGSGQSALHRFQRDVLSQPGVRWVIISDDPINDLGHNPPPSADELTQALSQLITSAHQAGVMVLCSTLTPFQGAGGWTPAGETGRDGYNAFVRTAGNGCDAIVDQDTATHNPAMPTWYLPADDSGDHLHPNDQGRQAIADAVPLDLFVAAAPTDAGAEGGTEAGADDGAPGAEEDAASVSDAGAETGAAPPGDAGVAYDAGRVEMPAQGSSCACQVAGVPSPRGLSPSLVLEMAGVAMACVRRCTRRRRSSRDRTTSSPHQAC